MKTVITSIYGNIQTKANHPKGVESTFLSRKYDADFMGKSGRTNKDCERFFDVSYIANLDDYDRVILQLEPVNFFGGKVHPETITKVRLLSTFKGELLVMVTDPRIKPINPAKVLSDRFGIFKDTEWVIHDMQEVLDNATYVFPGKDLIQFWGPEYAFLNVEYVDWFKEIFKEYFMHNDIAQWDGDENRIYDVVYYGDKRGSYREKQLQKYMPKLTRNLLVGYKSSNVIATFLKKRKHQDMLTLLNQCKVSLCLADKEHENNVLTFRFFEVLASNALLAIPITYDPNRSLIQDEELKDLLYVRDVFDVKRLVERYSRELVFKQKIELLNILNLNADHLHKITTNGS